MQIALVVIVVAWSATPFVRSKTRTFNQSVLLTQGNPKYCDLSCDSQDKHTMCKPDLQPGPECAGTLMLFDVHEFNTITLNGHNGLRNRVAEKYMVANMRHLQWDTELATMAKVWLMRCQRLRPDPCTQMRRQPNLTHTMVNQNVLFWRSEYLPEFFFARMLRLWYTEKWLSTGDRTPQSNNYTQMVNADTERIGCAAGGYADGYALICNYHMAVPNDGNPQWRTGRPCTRCPRNMPQCSHYFGGLCTADTAARSEPCTVLACILIVIGSLVLLE